MKADVQLKLIFAPLPHPFPNDPSSSGDIWSDLGMEIRDCRGQLVRKVFQAQWDAKEFLKWILNNAENLLKEDVPIPVRNRYISIAKVISDYLKSIDPETEDIELSDKLYLYRTHHDIWFGMRGTKAPDVYLGIINGHGTISYFKNKKDNWEYNVDISDFISQATKIYEGIRS